MAKSTQTKQPKRTNDCHCTDTDKPSTRTKNSKKNGKSEDSVSDCKNCK